MEKLKVIIVDDEFPIRRELQLFPWAEIGCVLSGEAKNGAEALELFDSVLPDIVITDIVMPVMDGLTLISKLKEKNENVQIILLTLFSNFDYAREAIRYGVNEYLIKGVYTFDDIKAAVEKSKVQMHNTLQLGRFMSVKKYKEMARQHFTYINSEGGEFGNLISRFTPFGLLYVFFDSEEFVDLIVNIDRLAIFKSVRIMHRMPLSANEAILFISTDYMQDIINEAEVLIKQSKEALSENEKCFISIGGIVDREDKYTRILKKCLLSMDNRFYSKGYEVFQADQTLFSHLDKQEQAVIYTKFTKLMSQPEDLKYYVRQELLPFFQKKNIVPEEVTVLLKYFLKENTPEYISKFHYSYSIYSVLDSFIDVVLKNYEFFCRSKRQEIDTAIQIICRDLSIDHTLQTVAEEVGLSASHLGRLWKAETGEGFKEYLTRMRMLKAAELLNTTNLKVYEVGFMVGYENYRSFSSAFFEYYKTTPRSYRK